MAVSPSRRTIGLTRDAVTAGLEEWDAPHVVPLTRQRKVGAGRVETDIKGEPGGRQKYSALTGRPLHLRPTPIQKVFPQIGCAVEVGPGNHPFYRSRIRPPRVLPNLLGELLPIPDGSPF